MRARLRARLDDRAHLVIIADEMFHSLGAHHDAMGFISATLDLSATNRSFPNDQSVIFKLRLTHQHIHAFLNSTICRQMDDKGFLLFHPLKETSLQIYIMHSFKRHAAQSRLIEFFYLSSKLIL